MIAAVDGSTTGVAVRASRGAPGYGTGRGADRNVGVLDPPVVGPTTVPPHVRIARADPRKCWADGRSRSSVVGSTTGPDVLGTKPRRVPTVICRTDRIPRGQRQFMIVHDLLSDAAKRWRCGLSSAFIQMQNGSSTTDLARVLHGNRQRRNPAADRIVVGPTTIPFEPGAERTAEPLHIADAWKAAGDRAIVTDGSAEAAASQARDERQNVEGVRR